MTNVSKLAVFSVFLPADPKGREPLAGKKVKLFHKLQNKVAPAIFNPRMIYDRQKLAYCPAQLSFNGNSSGSVSARSGYSSVLWFDPFLLQFYVHLDHDEVTPQTKGAYRIILTPTAGEVIYRR